MEQQQQFNQLPPEVLEASRLEGYLDKGKPGTLIGGFSKRYICFLEDGCVLAYATKKEDFEKGIIKGQLRLEDVTTIEIDQNNPTKFDMVLPTTSYKFSDKDPEVINKWVQALTTLQKYAKNQQITWERELKELDPDFVVEEDESASPMGKDQSSSFLSAIATGSKKAFVDLPLFAAVGVWKVGAKGVGNLLANNGKNKTDEEYLQAKKFDEVFSHIDENILKSRLKTGFLVKETLEATGNNVVDSIMNDAKMRETVTRHWCLLVSSKPLLYHEVVPDDEETLEPGSIPIDLNFDTLYLFNEVCDNTPCMEEVQMKDVLSISVKKKTRFSGSYQFVLDLGGRKLNFLCPTFKEMNMWLRALQASRATTGEYERSKLPKLKNIFWILKTKDTKDGRDGVVKLRQKVDKEYEKLTRESHKLAPNEVKPLISVLKKVAEEFYSVINACCAYRQPREDVIGIYRQVFHEGILKSLKAYFNRNAGDLQNVDMFEMINFMVEYNVKIKRFDSPILDRRLPEGITLLCKTVSRKILKANLRVVNNILKKQNDEQPTLDNRGRLISTAPVDLMKQLNDNVQALCFCTAEEFTTQLLDVCQNTLSYFENGLETLVDHADLSNEQMIGICNDIMSFVTDMKDFVSLLEKVTGKDNEYVKKHFDYKNHNKNFVIIGKRCIEKIITNIFEPIYDDPKLRWFLQTELAQVSNKTLKMVEDMVDKIHPNYATKLRTYLLKETVAFLVQTFLNSAEKKLLKKQNLPEIREKLRASRQIIQEPYDQFSDIKAAEIDRLLVPIQELEDFLTRNANMLSLAVQTLKKSNYGSEIKWSTIEYLLKLREGDTSQDVRPDTIADCRDVFKMTEEGNEEGKVHEKGRLELNKFSNDSVSQANQESTRSSFIRSSTASFASKNRMRTSTARFTMKLTIQGNLMIECGTKNLVGIKPNGRAEMRYVSVRKDNIYFYRNNKSENATATLSFKNVDDCKRDEPTKFVLKVVEDGVRKEYKFTAETDDKRNQWVNTIKNAVAIFREINDALENPSPGFDEIEDLEDLELEEDEAIPLFTEIEKMPSLVYEFVAKKPKVKDLLKASFATTGSFADSPMRRKKSLMLGPDGILIEEDDEDEPKVSMCSTFCMKLGLGRKKKKQESEEESVKGEAFQSFVTTNQRL